METWTADRGGGEG